MNVRKLMAMKNKSPITMVTAYDYFSAKACEEVGMDIVLVGDSLANVVLGYDSTLKVTMEDIVYHLRAVRRGAPNSFVVADMPFMAYQVSEEEGIRNAGKLMREGANAVKLEGGKRIAPLIKKLVDIGMPVMGHIGLTPQSVNQIGGYRVQGKGKGYERMIEDAKALEEAGAFSIVLELTTEEGARAVSESVSIPTIGIGAGRYCDGQVLVWHDLLGINDERKMKFVKTYADLSSQIKDALKLYVKDVKERRFPGEEHVFKDEGR